MKKIKLLFSIILVCLFSFFIIDFFYSISKSQQKIDENPYIETAERGQPSVLPDFAKSTPDYWVGDLVTNESEYFNTITLSCNYSNNGDIFQTSVFQRSRMENEIRYTYIDEDGYFRFLPIITKEMIGDANLNEYNRDPEKSYENVVNSNNEIIEGTTEDGDHPLKYKVTLWNKNIGNNISWSSNKDGEEANIVRDYDPIPTNMVHIESSTNSSVTLIVPIYIGSNAEEKPTSLKLVGSGIENGGLEIPIPNYVSTSYGVKYEEITIDGLDLTNKYDDWYVEWTTLDDSDKVPVEEFGSLSSIFPLYIVDSFKYEEISSTEVDFSLQLNSNGYPFSEENFETYYRKSDESEIKKIENNDFELTQEGTGNIWNYSAKVTSSTGFPRSEQFYIYLYPEGKDEYDNMVNSNDPNAKYYQIFNTQMKIIFKGVASLKKVDYNLLTVEDSDEYASIQLFIRVYENNELHGAANPEEFEFRYTDSDNIKEFGEKEYKGYDEDSEVYEFTITKLEFNHVYDNFEVRIDDDGEWEAGGTIVTGSKTGLYIEDSYHLSEVGQNTVTFEFEALSGGEYETLTKSDIEIRLVKDKQGWNDGFTIENDYFNLLNDTSTNIAKISVEMEESNDFLQPDTHYNVYVSISENGSQKIGDFTTTVAQDPIDYSSFQLVGNVGKTSFTFQFNIFVGSEYATFDEKKLTLSLGKTTNEEDSKIIEESDIDFVNVGGPNNQMRITINGLEEETTYAGFWVKYDSFEKQQVLIDGFPITTGKLDPIIVTSSIEVSQIEPTSAILSFNITTRPEYEVDLNQFKIVSDVYDDKNKNQILDSEEDVLEESGKELDIDITQESQTHFIVEIFNLEEFKIYNNIYIYPDGTEAHKTLWSNGDEIKEFSTTARENSFEIDPDQIDYSVQMHSFEMKFIINDDGEMNAYEDVFDDKNDDGIINSDEFVFLNGDFNDQDNIVGIYSEEERLTLSYFDAKIYSQDSSTSIKKWIFSFEAVDLKANKEYRDIEIVLGLNTKISLTDDFNIEKMKTLPNKLKQYIIIGTTAFLLLILIIIIIIIVYFKKLRKTHSGREFW